MQRCHRTAVHLDLTRPMYDAPRPTTAKRPAGWDRGQADVGPREPDMVNAARYPSVTAAHSPAALPRLAPRGDFISSSRGTSPHAHAWTPGWCLPFGEEITGQGEAGGAVREIDARHPTPSSGPRWRSPRSSSNDDQFAGSSPRVASRSAQSAASDDAEATTLAAWCCWWRVSPKCSSMSSRDVRSPAIVHSVYAILAGDKDLPLEMLQRQCGHNDSHRRNDREHDPPWGTHERAARKARPGADPADMIASSQCRSLEWAPGPGRIRGRLGVMDHQRPERHGDHRHVTSIDDVAQRDASPNSPGEAMTRPREPSDGLGVPLGSVHKGGDCDLV